MRRSAERQRSAGRNTGLQKSAGKEGDNAHFELSSDDQPSPFDQTAIDEPIII
jgi:hypothetical protein